MQAGAVSHSAERQGSSSGGGGQRRGRGVLEIDTPAGGSRCGQEATGGQKDRTGQGQDRGFVNKVSSRCRGRVKKTTY